MSDCEYLTHNWQTCISMQYVRKNYFIAVKYCVRVALSLFAAH